MWTQNPATGIGLEMVRETTPEHEPPHNVFVQTLVEGGIVALVTLLALLATLAFDLRHAGGGLGQGSSSV